jgi:hypothetical protein
VLPGRFLAQVERRFFVVLIDFVVGFAWFVNSRRGDRTGAVGSLHQPRRLQHAVLEVTAGILEGCTILR